MKLFRSHPKSVIGASVVVIILVVAGIWFVRHVLRRHGIDEIPAALVPANWEAFHASVGHRTHVDDHEIACKECHDYEREGFKNPGVAPCAKCHAAEKTKTHEFDAKAPGNCLSCHAFAPVEVASCISCHANAQGSHAAIGIHATTKCTTCHNPHAKAAISATTCTGCHQELTPSHADHAGSQGCLDCHTGHATAAAAKTTCSQCHTAPQGPKPANHDSCLSCHTPHTFVAGGEKACVGCHGVKPTLAASTVSAHADCLGCHTPHSPTEAANSCSHCHQNVRTSHPAVTTLGLVTSATVCTTCHAPHGSPDKIATDCTTCHSTVARTATSAHAGGIACTTCHTPHDFGKPVNTAAFCSSCHAKEQALTAINAGHADCTHCHGSNAHQPTSSPTCGSCHAKEKATAPLGHQTCTHCHDAHSGARAPQVTCVSCHAKESHDAHAVAVGNCTTCHSAHGPQGVASPPTCTNCHVRPKLAGLHSENGHATCTSCHTPHDPPRSDRATCTTGCHTDKRAHQSAASACSGCHVFK